MTNIVKKLREEARRIDEEPAHDPYGSVGILREAANEIEMLLMPPIIMSIKEIADLLRKQANLRSLENDEAGILEELADSLERQVKELEI